MDEVDIILERDASELREEELKHEHTFSVSELKNQGYFSSPEVYHLFYQTMARL